MVFTPSGRMTAAEMAELKALFATDYRSLVLDLRDLRLVDRDSVRFLRDCELSGVRPRVDGKGKKLREPAFDSSCSREVYRSDEHIFFGAERCLSL